MNQFPLMLYHPDGRTTVVQTAEQEAAASGFGRTPHPVHRSEGALAPDRVVAVHAAGRDDLALLVADTVIARLIDMFDLSPKQADEGTVLDEIAAPRRGRPRKIDQTGGVSAEPAAQAAPTSGAATLTEA